jgi:endonuclease YncB( thermonuclease family)
VSSELILTFIFGRGVDAPEIGQRYGEESKEKLSDLVKGHRLRIHVYTRDQYGRAVGDVHCNDMFIQVCSLPKILSLG